MQRCARGKCRTFWEQSPWTVQCWEGPELRAQTERSFTFPATGTGEQHSLEAGGRDGGKHQRKIEISGRMVRDGLSDTQSRLKDISPLRSICWSLAALFQNLKIAAPGRATGACISRKVQTCSSQSYLSCKRGKHACSWEGARASSSSQPGKTWAGTMRRWWGWGRKRCRPDSDNWRNREPEDL